MVDMGQADRTLRRTATMQPLTEPSWTVALQRAAETMGLAHYADATDAQCPELHQHARALRAAACKGVALV